MALHPWTVRALPLAGRTGSEVFYALYGQLQTGLGEPPWRAIATLLESPYPLAPDLPQARLCRYSLCAGPPRWRPDGPALWTPPIGSILPCLRDRLLSHREATPPLRDEQGQPWSHSLEPFSGGWLGWLGYELAWEIERLPLAKPDPLPFPVAFWYEPETFAIADHQTQTLYLAVSNPADLNAFADQLDQSPRLSLSASPPTAPQSLTFGSDQDQYEAAIRAAQAAIQAGDIFQANLSLRFAAPTQLDSWSLYQHLHRINPSPFASYWRTPWGAVVSCSPERLVCLRGDRAETRPIAGTRPRGRSNQQDQTLAQDLSCDPKEQAEHIMLVDLERNDLGRVCTWGSVQVDELLVLEPYSHVMHLVSNVIGQLHPRYGPVDLIRALFPGGTITGCPKVRCMEIISALEPVSRNLFYGSCGYLDSRGHLDLNILIRTLLWVPQDPGLATVYGQVGAGIVADSQPTAEWREALHKAEAQLLALGLKKVQPQEGRS